MTLWHDGEEMENRKTGKSMEVVARLEAMVDGGVMELGLGHGFYAIVLDNGRKTKRIEWCSTVLTFEFSNFHFFDLYFFYLKKSIK